MRDLIIQFFFRVPLIPPVETAAIVVLSRKRIRLRLNLVLASYLSFAALAFAFAVLNPDEFGYGFIPAFLIVWPWPFLLQRLPFAASLPTQVLLGSVLNCTVCFLLDRLSYPRQARTVSGRHAM